MWSYMAYSFFKETQGILSFQLLYTCKKKKTQQQQKTEMRACIRKTVTKMHLQLVQQNLNKYIKHMHTACHYSQ